jgi:hypothetical protein
VNLAAHPSAFTSRSRPGTFAPFSLLLGFGSRTVSRAVHQHNTTSPLPVNSPPLPTTATRTLARARKRIWLDQGQPPHSRNLAMARTSDLPRAKTSRASRPHTSCKRGRQTTQPSDGVCGTWSVASVTTARTPPTAPGGATTEDNTPCVCEKTRQRRRPIGQAQPGGHLPARLRPDTLWKL